MKALKLTAGALAVGTVLTAAGALASQGGETASPEAARCERLTGSRLAGGVIEKARRVARGTPNVFVDRPASVDLCHIKARISAEPGSDIRTEVWLPDNWNGKLLATGGGGFSGGLNSGAAPLMPPHVAKGFAAVANDAGHDRGSLDWAFSRPKLVDFTYRANHLATLFAKAAAADYYGAPAKRAYFTGCSNGGRDALIQGQRFPDDYDGIISAAPANNWTALLSSFVWQYKVLNAPGAAGLGSKLGLLNDAVLAKCDQLDGVKDGVLENPPSCRFDPAMLRCKAEARADCLTDAEITAAREFYRGPRTRDGRQVHAGMPLGSEREWISITQPKGGLNEILGTPYFRYFVHQDPKWSPDSFELDRDYALSKQRMASLIDATDPDMRPFARHGGKLLMWHGWNDAAIGAENSVEYYKALNRRLGPLAGQARLFMAPGVRHCALGVGPSNFDMIAELDRWVETDVAPKRVVATKYENDILVLAGQTSKPARTRPLCAWPMIARYKGSGSTDDEANFVCRKPH